MEQKNNTEIGLEAEAFAEQYLVLRGYKKIAKNIRYKFGEIDLIMRDKEELVFVEVRSSGCVSPFLEYSITYKKLSRIRKAINFYNFLNPSSRPCRLDVVWIKNFKHTPQVEHLKNIMV